MSKRCLLVLMLMPTMLVAQIISPEKVQKTLDKAVDNKRIFGAVVSIGTRDASYHFASGNMAIGDVYFIASITKMYTAAALFKLVDQNKLRLDDPIHQYLPESTLSGLHVFQDKEYSNHITLRHLVTNTSGLSDYFTQGNKRNDSLLDHLISRGDTSLTFDEIIELTKSLPPQFPPGTKGKAHYSDSNFQLLGKIIENVTGKSLSEVFDAFIFRPLDLKQTYVYTNPSDTSPANMNYKSEVLRIPNMMASFQADGGIVSTSGENLVFLKAHLNGALFSKTNTRITSEWNKIYSPFHYGYGIMKFKFLGMQKMIGHAGANGSFAYYIPAKDVYITGTINQIDRPRLAYTLTAKLLATVESGCYCD